jgi:hypothetical protein
MFKLITSKIGNYLNHYSVYKTRELMLQMDDEILQQAGISRQLLQRGTDYWPWQITEDAQPQAAVQSAPRAVSPVVDIAAADSAVTNAPVADAPVALEPTEKAA